MKKVLDNKKIVILGAGGAGLLLASAFSIYYPSLAILVLEKSKLQGNSYKDFIIPNSKSDHANIFSYIFIFLFKKYFKKISSHISDHFGNLSQILPRKDFFSFLIYNVKSNNLNLITDVSNVSLKIQSTFVNQVEFCLHNETKQINCDYVFDCTGSKKFFFFHHKKKRNLIIKKKDKVKIKLITFNLRITDKEERKIINNLINKESITFNIDKFKLTIIKQLDYYTFTFVSDATDLDKIIANKILKKFFSLKLISSYEILKVVQWIHTYDYFLDLKDHSLINNLIPVGDSFSMLNPKSGFGYTSILFQVIYIIKNFKKTLLLAEIFNLKKYFKFSNKFFELSSKQSITNKHSKNNFPFLLRSIQKFFSKNKKFIPFYKIIRSLFYLLADRIYYRECFKEIS